jgi:quinoprotein relay system zinc metallohydrolase 2
MRIIPRLLWLGFMLAASVSALPAAERPVVEVAPGVYMRPGLQEVTSERNHGHIANLGFIVGNKAVAVIDTGNSYQEGLELRRSIREITALPIKYVILTHMHPDHTLGSTAFDRDGAIFVGHAQLKDALIRRQSYYLKRAEEVLGSAAEGSGVVYPSITVEVGDDLELDLGDRKLKLHAYPTAHTNNDLTVYDEKTDTLWLSDLLFIKRIPVIDGSLLGWLKVMDGLRQLNVARVVPGHGPLVADWKQALADQRRYLETLASGIRRIIRDDGTIEQAVQSVGRKEKDKWLLSDEYRGRNVTAGFVELEWE